MKKDYILVTGNNIKSIVDEINNDERFYCELIEFDKDTYIFTSEKYFLRINSNLLTTLTLKIVSESECKILLISGGGKEGLLEIGFGAEYSRNEEVMKVLRSICSENGWEINELK